VHKHFPAWRKYREYGGGMVTDFGAHMIDIVQWGLGEDKGGPIGVLPPAQSGDKDGAKLMYAGGIPMEHVNGKGNGASFFGTEGELHLQRGKIRMVHQGKEVAKFWDKGDRSALPVELGKLEKTFLKDAKVKLYNSRDHAQDFIDAVRSRKQPICGVETGARTAIACHLLGFAYYHGKRFDWSPSNNTFANGTGDPAWLHRPYRGDWKLA
jgi:predicted dehydrogenase